MMHQEETKRLESLDGEVTPHVVEEPEIHIQDELPITLPTTCTADSRSVPSKEEKGQKKKSSSSTRKDAPVLSKEKVEDWEKVSDVYNGAEMENYKWSQTINDIDVRVPVPDGTTAKDVKVDIRSDHLKVELRRPTPQVYNSVCCSGDPLPMIYLYYYHCA